MNVLQEAESLINGDRKRQYGSATEAYTRLASIWSGYLGVDLTPQDTINMMVLLKVSRAKETYHRDSYVDIAGYAALGERLHDEAADAEPDDWWSLQEVVDHIQKDPWEEDYDNSLWTLEDVDREEWELDMSLARTEYEE